MYEKFEECVSMKDLKVVLSKVHLFTMLNVGLAKGEKLDYINHR